MHTHTHTHRTVVEAVERDSRTRLAAIYACKTSGYPIHLVEKENALDSKRRMADRVMYS